MESNARSVDLLALAGLILLLVHPALQSRTAPVSFDDPTFTLSEPYILVPSSVRIPSTDPSTAPKGLLVLLHGEGGDERAFAEVFREVAEKERLILASFRGPVRLEDGGYAWFEKGSALEKDSKALYAPLIQALRKLKKSYNLSRSGFAVAGFSKGAVIALDLGLHFPGLFPGGVICISGKGYRALTGKDSLKRSAAVGQRVFMIHGIKDAPGEGVKAVALLNDEGIKCTLHEFRMGHALPPRFELVISRALKWLRE